ncbi:MAG: GLUG motif-containing protein [Planctomycetota bacterium]|jgi:hypothetical protein
MSGKWSLRWTGAILSFVAVFFLAANVSEAKYSGGTGEPNDPYRIATPNDLNDIGNHVEDYNKCFILVNDINMAGFTYTTALIAPDTNNITDYFQGTAFTGIFDGNDCIISSLIIDTAGAGNDYLGLFGQVEGPGEVLNLGIEDVNITGGDESYGLGGLCGFNDGGTIENCYGAGSVSGGDESYGLGGLCALNDGGTIENCCATASVSGEDCLGGLCGGNGGTISNCYATGPVTGGYGSWRLGGLCGSNGGTISNCYATGPVTGGQDCQCVGGLSGDNFGGTISKCYSSSSVSGTFDSRYLGGLCGRSDYGVISECWASGSVYGSTHSFGVGGLVGENRTYIADSYAIADVSGHGRVGGLVGYNVGDIWPGGEIHRAYAAGPVSGSEYVGAFVGEDAFDAGFYAGCFWDRDINPGLGGIGNTTDPNVIAKTTAEMQTETTFTDAGWDFVEVWNIGESQTYPFLRTHPPGDLNHDGLVNFEDVAILALHWLEGT